MIDDPNPSLEFDRFEDLRRRLSDVLVAEGHELLVAEKIALYLIEGMRDMAKLMSLLADDNPQAHEEILYVLGNVLDHAPAFHTARLLFIGDEEIGTAV